jgi:SAM-dependent methyltransferase
MRETAELQAKAQCPICDCRRIRQEVALGAAYRECRECGFVWRIDYENFPDPNQAYAAADEAVQELLEQETAPGRAAYFQAQLKRLHCATTPPGRLLELGCGTGGLANAAQGAGWDVWALEPGPVLRRQAERLLGPERVLGNTLEAAEFPAGHFQAILALDLLEHLPEPLALVRHARQWLKEGGVLLLQTPNARSLRRFLHGAHWNMIQPDRHFVFHTVRSLRTMLTRHDFSLITLQSVSGVGAGGALRRTGEKIYGRALSLFALGNALYALAEKTAPVAESPMEQSE